MQLRVDGYKTPSLWAHFPAKLSYRQVSCCRRTALLAEPTLFGIAPRRRGGVTKHRHSPPTPDFRTVARGVTTFWSPPARRVEKQAGFRRPKKSLSGPLALPPQTLFPAGNCDADRRPVSNGRLRRLRVWRLGLKLKPTLVSSSLCPGLPRPAVPWFVNGTPARNRRCPTTSPPRRLFNGKRPGSGSAQLNRPTLRPHKGSRSGFGFR